MGTSKSRVQSSDAYASHLSDQSDTINTSKSMWGVVMEILPIVLLHVSLCVITDFHFHIPNTMYNFLCCHLFSTFFATSDRQ